MMKRMKSDQVRQNWRDVLDHVRTGGIVVVEHYNRAVARLISEDDTLVTLRVRNANDAERLRRLVRDHGSLGIPFPNNTTPGWRVVDENGEPVNPHSINSVGVEIANGEERER
jgi:antitoxin (DNA-binding transcriptional repressor) of toxin-antitoxin stability system